MYVTRLISVLLNKGATSKKVIVFGGAHHKVEDPPTPKAIVVKLPLFVGGIFPYYEKLKKIQLSLEKYLVSASQSIFDNP